MPPTELGTNLDEISLRLSRSGRRQTGTAVASRGRTSSTAELMSKMTTLETEIDALLDRIGAEDPEAVRRVRGALSDLHTYLEPPG